jgi:hypothetical protein
MVDPTPSLRTHEQDGECIESLGGLKCFLFYCIDEIIKDMNKNKNETVQFDWIFKCGRRK